MSYALTVLSGGMDSTVLAYLARGLFEKVDLVSVDYGQRHRIELEYASRTARQLGCRHDVLELPLGPMLSGSALTDDEVQVPHGHYASGNMALTVVPNRNAILISLTYAVAVSREADAVLVGVHAGDQFVYPDCKPSFVDALGRALQVGNEGIGDVRLEAPFVHRSKTDIARLGHRLSVDWGSTWSCYEGGEVHCGRCGTCVERREAFHDAGIKDPTDYLDTAYACEVLAGGKP